MTSTEEEFRVAVLARKGRRIRSKSEAKREAKQQRFKGTDTIIKDVIPSMTKPVNIMSYDMRDFWSLVLTSIVNLPVLAEIA